MSQLETFFAEGNEKADELATEGAMLDGGDMAQVRAVTIQQEREEAVCAHCNMELASTVWWRNGKIVTSSDQSQKRSVYVHEMQKKQQTHEDQSGCEKTPDPSWEDGAKLEVHSTFTSRMRVSGLFIERSFVWEGTTLWEEWIEREKP